MLGLFRLLYSTVRGFIEGDGLTLAAAISFYAALSASPLLVLIFWVASKIGLNNQEQILDQLSAYAGSQTVDFAQSLLQNLHATPHLETWAGFIGFAVLLISAGGVFVQLRLSLNRMWNPSGEVSFTLRYWMFKRLISIGMVFSLPLLVGASILSTSALTFAAEFFETQTLMPSLLSLADALLSLLAFTTFFALLFRFLPDAAPAWKFIGAGSLVTALLFTLGKTLIAIYLGYSSFSSAFGAAGSLVVFLVWVYYSSAILLFGAELTQQLSIRTHSQ